MKRFKDFLNENIEEISLPIKILNKVYHVGTMDIKKKINNSLEGSGLSVSLHPEEWKKISTFTKGETITLTKHNGQFINFYKLKKNDRDNIINWGIENNYVERKETYKVYYGDGTYMEFDDIDKAKYEAGEEYKIRINKKGGLIPTDKLKLKTLQKRIDIVQVFDLLITVYGEECTNCDGVWWNDFLYIYEYSAPRGVIFNKKIKDWKVEII